MSFVLMQLGGVVGAATGLIHGYLGERKLFAVARIEPSFVRHMAQLGWQCGSVAWFVVGILLIVSAGFPAGARRSIILAVIVIYLAGAVGNAVLTRGKHFGWFVLTVAIALAATGW